MTAAFTELIRRSRARRSITAQDVAQDVCVRVLQSTAPRPIRNPDHYLARAARNLLIDHNRRSKRESALFEPSRDSGLAAVDALDPERIVAGEQALARVLVAIDDLPPRCREAFVLHRFDGLTYVGIAHHMGISVSMVEQHISEAILRLARTVEAALDVFQPRSSRLPQSPLGQERCSSPQKRRVSES
jgi:RNA polymerase sigma factor (sigma-70 family)